MNNMSPQTSSVQSLKHILQVLTRILIIHNPQHRLWLLIPQQTQHLSTHLHHRAPRNSQELILLLSNGPPNKEEPMNNTSEVRRCIVPTTMVSRAHKDKCGSRRHLYQFSSASQFHVEGTTYQQNTLHQPEPVYHHPTYDSQAQT